MVRKFFDMQQLKLADDSGALGMSRPMLSQAACEVVGYTDIPLAFTL